MRSTQSIRDQVALASNPARLRVPCFKVIDALQKTKARPGDQILAAAITLVAMCESAGINFNDLIGKAIRMTSDVEGPFTAHLQSVRDYASYELRRGGM